MAFRRPQTARLTSLAVALALAGVSSLPAGCTKVPLVAPSGTVITLIATTNTLPINGAADIIAVLVENGTAPSTGTGTTTTTSTGNPVHNGTLVTFTTTLGRVEPAEMKTSNGGQATVKLIADGRSGVATITAFSGGASKTLTVTIGSAAATRVLVSAVPTTLPANGGTSTITANVQDQQGNPIQGVPVTFSTTSGSLSVVTAASDSSGNAKTLLTTNANATVTAAAGGGGTSTLQGTVNLTIQSRATLNLTPPTGTVTVGVPTTFIVTVGANVAATGVVLDYGDGTVDDLGVVSGSTQVTHVYEEPVRTYTVTARGTFVDGTVVEQKTSVVVNDYDFNVSCGPNVAFGGTSTLSVTINPSSLVAQDVVWNFGSGERNGVVSGTQTTYTWQTRGTKIVSAQVRPGFAPSKTRQCTLEVN
jgi:hypothetical protein